MSGKSKWKHRTAEGKRKLYQRMRKKSLEKRLKEYVAWRSFNGFSGLRVPRVNKWFPGVEEVYESFGITSEDVYIPMSPNKLFGLRNIRTKKGTPVSNQTGRRQFKYRKYEQNTMRQRATIAPSKELPRNLGLALMKVISKTQVE